MGQNVNDIFFARIIKQTNRVEKACFILTKKLLLCHAFAQIF